MANFPQNVYARNLLSHRGYPLWTPEPNIELPESYQREGLKIGDVGVVDPEGGNFDVFFNVTLPPEHPLHAADGVPNNFTQIKLRREDYNIILDAEGSDRVIPSSAQAVGYTVRCVDPFNIDGATHRLTSHQFILHQNEGAMLILPQGAERHRLTKRLLLLDVIIEHAVDWYRFARERLYRDIGNDDLYLITGFHKARSWSLASFTNTCASSACCNIVQLRKAGPMLLDDSTWEYAHPLEWRIGPRHSDGIPNQSVFIVGFKIAVNEELLHLKRVTIKIDHSKRTLASKIVGTGAWLANMLSGMAPESINSPQDTSQDEGVSETALEHGSPEDEREPVRVEHIPQLSQLFHPSDIINRYMLREEPSAMIAVTHDSQWIALLEKGILTQQDILKEGILEATVAQEYDIITRDGAVYLQSIQPNTPRRSPTSSLSQLSDICHRRSPDGGSEDIREGATDSFASEMAFDSEIGDLAPLTITRTSTNNDRKEVLGRSSSTGKLRSLFSLSTASKDKGKDIDESTISSASTESTRTRSRSFILSFYSRNRDYGHSLAPLPLVSDSECHSPAPLPLVSYSESTFSWRSPAVRPQNAFTDDGGSSSVFAGEEFEDEKDDWSDEDGVPDFLTECNTEQNAQTTVVANVSKVDGDGDVDAAMDPDPLGEGVNVIVPPEPYFPSTLNRSSFGSTREGRGAPKREKSKHHELLPLSTSRPIFQRDRCTITVIQGHPESSGRRKKKYIIASDLSEESRYAVEWGIGTILRDGDELIIVTIAENENKVDPVDPNPGDRATKLRRQQERHGLAYILLRQATSLLQRTRLHVSVSCQAWHAKNARHILVDIVNHNEPTMLIVGPRGLGRRKGILLGSTSHYLIQSAHLAKHHVHVSLAEAGIDRVADEVDHAVAVMRDEMQRECPRRGEEGMSTIEETGEGEEGEGGDEGNENADEDNAESEVFLAAKVKK